MFDVQAVSTAFSLVVAFQALCDAPRTCQNLWSHTVYRGGLTFGNGMAALAPVDAGHNLAVREGTYSHNCDIQVQLAGLNAEVAWHVQDGQNSYRLVQRCSNGSAYEIWVYPEVNGWLMGPLHAVYQPEYDFDGGPLHIQVKGDDLGIWVYLDGNWQTLVNPALAWPGGQGAMAGSPGGLVGLGAGPGASTSCSLLRVWMADSSSDLLASGTHEIPLDKRVVDETFATSVTPTYDAAGNMISDGVYQYRYDAWNHLVQVMRQGPTGSGTTPQVIATYHYDGLGRRIYKKVENSGDKNRTEYFYYNANWQLLEIADSSNKAKQQFVWGTQYIDEAICMDMDTDTLGTGYGNCRDTGGSRRFFYCQDAN